jgi:hypothetical protein
MVCSRLLLIQQRPRVGRERCQSCRIGMKRPRGQPWIAGSRRCPSKSNPIHPSSSQTMANVQWTIFSHLMLSSTKLTANTVRLCRFRSTVTRSSIHRALLSAFTHNWSTYAPRVFRVRGERVRDVRSFAMFSPDKGAGEAQGPRQAPVLDALGDRDVHRTTGNG